MIAESLAVLVDLTLASSAAALFVLVLRRPLRFAFGARAAYALWLLVPIAMAVLLLLPSPTPEMALPGVSVLASSLSAPPAAAAGAEDSGLFAALLILWFAGVVLALRGNIGRQREFQRALGALQARNDGCLQSESVDVGPAVIGMWSGRIVVPADFETRYSAEERELILSHERVHLRRRDLLVNSVAMVLRCLGWFNPIVHRAVASFRFDQELAADAVVLAERPGARRHYADAMLKAQWSALNSPLGCHWQSVHPLKERILMLKRPLPGFPRSFFGFLTAGLLALSFGYAAWAAQPAVSEEIVTPASYASMAPPQYPQSAIDARLEGTVLLKLLVSVEGRAQKIEVVTSAGSEILDNAAKAAVAQWTFNPAIQDGKPVTHWVQVPITFSLDETAGAATSPPREDALDEIFVRQ